MNWATSLIEYLEPPIDSINNVYSHFPEYGQGGGNFYIVSESNVLKSTSVNKNAHQQLRPDNLIHPGFNE